MGAQGGRWRRARCTAARVAPKRPPAARRRPSHTLLPSLPTVLSPFSAGPPRTSAAAALAAAAAAAAAAAVATTSAHAEAASPATPPRAPAPPCGTMCDAAPWVRGLAAGVGVAEVLSAAALEKQAHAFLGADHMVRGGNAW